jgi:hypothetical protein
MRKIIVVTGLVLVVASLAVLMALDSSIEIVLFGSARAASQFQNGQFPNGQFSRGNFTAGVGNFSFQGGGGGGFRGGQSGFQSAFTTVYYRFSAYLVGIAGIVVTAIGTVLKPKSKESYAQDKE